MSSRREPVFAGTFYPASTPELRRTVTDCLDAAREIRARGRLRAVIAPHAGYVYSGPVAGTAYALAIEERPSHVVLFGPSHRVRFDGLALSTADVFSTPLGDVRIDRELASRIDESPCVGYLDAAHANEHSTEVHLPFIQETFGDVPVLPIVVGDARPGDVAQIIEALAEDPSVFFVFSSDLSHFLDDETAREVDRRTAERIVSMERVAPEEACGCRGINGLLLWAKREGLHIEALDLRNSSDTSGDKGRVVGYGAFGVFDRRG